MRGVALAAASLLTLVGGPPSHARTVTEMQFVDSALADHPRVVAARAAVAVAEGDRTRAETLANPEIGWEREDPDLTARQDTWRLSWRLPFDGRRHRVAAARAAVEAAEARLDAVRLEVRRELTALYAHWYVASERERVLDRHVEDARRLASWLRARAEEGEAAEVEARRLELEVEVASRALARARGEAAAARAAAAAWSQEVSPSVRPVRPQLAPPPSSADVGDRADLEALSRTLEEAEAKARLHRRALEPPELSVGWLELRDAGRTVDGPVLGVSWPVPVFDRNQGRRRAAAAAADGARARLEAARSRAVQRADAALASYTPLYDVVDRSAESVIERDVVEATLAAFGAGEATLTDVLDSLRATLEVAEARLDTLEAALAAEAELEAAIGGPFGPGGSR